MTVGCVAGDEETYEVFKELLDPVIEDRHGGYKPTDKHKTDLIPENLQVNNNKRIADDSINRRFCSVLIGRLISGFYCDSTSRVETIWIQTTFWALVFGPDGASVASVCRHTVAVENAAPLKTSPLKVWHHFLPFLPTSWFRKLSQSINMTFLHHIYSSLMKMYDNLLK